MVRLPRFCDSSLDFELAVWSIDMAHRPTRSAVTCIRHRRKLRENNIESRPTTRSASAFRQMVLETQPGNRTGGLQPFDPPDFHPENQPDPHVSAHHRFLTSSERTMRSGRSLQRLDTEEPGRARELPAEKPLLLSRDGGGATAGPVAAFDAAQLAEVLQRVAPPDVWIAPQLSPGVRREALAKLPADPPRECRLAPVSEVSAGGLMSKRSSRWISHDRGTGARFVALAGTRGGAEDIAYLKSHAQQRLVGSWG